MDLVTVVNGFGLVYFKLPLVIAHWVFPLMENVDRKKKKLILGQWKRPGVGQGPNSKLQADKKDADQYIRLSETEGKRGRTLIPIMPPNLRTLVAKCRGGMDSLLRFSSSTASNAPEIKSLLLAEIKNPNHMCRAWIWLLHHLATHPTLWISPHAVEKYGRGSPGCLVFANQKLKILISLVSCKSLQWLCSCFWKIKKKVKLMYGLQLLSFCLVLFWW